MRYRKLADNRGFSLVEMMVVIAIIGILATVVIPRGSRQTELTAALDGDARVLAQNLRLAREKAMTQGVGLAIRFTDASEYEMVNMEDNTVVKSGIALNRGITGPATGTTIQFNVDGTLDNATSITLETTDGRKREVTVNKLGLVSVGKVQP